ncbi:unnamed protein product [Phytomonas sp. Hart1]|nr:unnamed protein product [Phytomonas sp. Hart1]|eukprot:CCW70671.1 unnamed protein product [Phytomonas sp. isolate Hart1]
MRKKWIGSSFIPSLRCRVSLNAFKDGNLRQGSRWMSMTSFLTRPALSFVLSGRRWNSTQTGASSTGVSSSSSSEELIEKTLGLEKKRVNSFLQFIRGEKSSLVDDEKEGGGGDGDSRWMATSSSNFTESRTKATPRGGRHLNKPTLEEKWRKKSKKTTHLPIKSKNTAQMAARNNSDPSNQRSIPSDRRRSVFHPIEEALQDLFSSSPPGDCPYSDLYLSLQTLYQKHFQEKMRIPPSIMDSIAPPSTRDFDASPHSLQQSIKAAPLYMLTILTFSYRECFLRLINCRPPAPHTTDATIPNALPAMRAHLTTLLGLHQAAPPAANPLQLSWKAEVLICLVECLPDGALGGPGIDDRTASLVCAHLERLTGAFIGEVDRVNPTGASAGEGPSEALEGGARLSQLRLACRPARRLAALWKGGGLGGPVTQRHTALWGALTAHLYWLTQALSPRPLRCVSLGLGDRTRTEAGDWERKGLEGAERLWGILLPLAQPCALTHRTIHATLNIPLVQHFEMLRRGGAGMGPFAQFWLRHRCWAASLVRAWTVLFDAAAQSRGRGGEGGLTARGNSLFSPPFSPQACAILARVGLAIEGGLAFVAAGVLARECGAPLAIPNAPTLVSFEKETERTRCHFAEGLRLTKSDFAGWEEIAQDCAVLRTRGAEYIRNVFSALIQAELAAPPTARFSAGDSPHGGETRVEGKKMTSTTPSRHFLSMIRSSFFPLMRRHYLLTGGGGTDGDRALWLPCLEVFLLLRKISTDFDEPLFLPSTKGSSRQPWIETQIPWLRACGTTLSQALEVAFFLSLVMHSQSEGESSSFDILSGEKAGGRYSSLLNCAWMTPKEVETYVAEVLVGLQRSTTRQLAHLCGRADFADFTALQTGETFPGDAILQRRRVQSIVSVVHGHVLHPSFLWMPLWQVQEVVWIAEQHLHLLFPNSQTPPRVPSTAATLTNDAGGSFDENDLVVDPFLAELDDRRSISLQTENEKEKTERHDPSRMESSSPSLFEGAGVVVKGRRVNLGKMHGYLVLRLYTLSNVLRSLRDLLGGDSSLSSSCEHGKRGLLEAVARFEPPAESKKRRERAWARQLAMTLHEQYPTLPAESEGAFFYYGNDIYNIKQSAACVVWRLENTISRALANHLFFNVSRSIKARRSQGRHPQQMIPSTPSPLLQDTIPKKENGKEERENACPRRLKVELCRSRGDASLGFVLDASTAVLRRVVDDSFSELSSSFSSLTSSLSLSPHFSSPLTPFRVGVQNTGVENAEELLGWRVVEVDGDGVATGKDVLQAIKGKLQFTMMFEETAR